MSTETTGKVVAKFRVKARMVDSGSNSNGTATPSDSIAQMREDWLVKASQMILNTAKQSGYNYPPPLVSVSCGFTGIGGRHSKRTGVTWDKEASKDGKMQIYISPIVDDPLEVVAALSHEMAHAIAGPKERHGYIFSRVAATLGLQRPYSKPTPTWVTKDIAAKMVAAHGKYPHGSLETAALDKPELAGATKQATRMLKLVCKQSGYLIRTTRSWIAKYGPPLSPVTKQPMEEAP